MSLHASSCCAVLQTGSIFSPYLPQVGGSGGVSGLVAVLAVELSQSWRYVRRPWRELAKLGAVCAALAVAGTLPFVSSFVLAGGSLVGLLASVVVLPYITFGSWNVVRKRVLVAAALPALVVVVVAVFVVFYHVQGGGCGAVCRYVNCVPYTDTVCNITELW